MKTEVQGLPFCCTQPTGLRKNQAFNLNSLLYILSEQIPAELRIQGLAAICTWTDGVLRAMRKAVERIKAFAGLPHPSLHFPSPALRPLVFPPAESLELA